MDCLPEFARAFSGDVVVISPPESRIDDSKLNWSIVYIIYSIGGARDSSSNSLFQVINIDTGEVSIINADLVRRILSSNNKH